MPRLFLGSFLSNEQQIAFARLKGANSGLDNEWNCHVRWVAAEKLHMTWLFIGHVNEDTSLSLQGTIGPLIQELQLRERLYLPFERLEAWSAQGSPRHIVLVPDRIDSQIVHLAEKLRNGLGRFVAGDSKKQASHALVPHITLMRLSPHGKERAKLPVTWASDSDHPLRHRRKMEADRLDFRQIKGLAELLPLKQKLDVVSLIESYSQADSHRYRILKDFPLVGSQGD
jgi:2'-5' RNA ligase